MALTQFSPIAGYYHGVLAATEIPYIVSEVFGEIFVVEK